MDVTIDRDSLATITMTADELGVIRYALVAGVEKLASTAGFLRSMRSEEADSATATAARSKEAMNELEAAVDRYCHR